jgi:hypothetical protein
LSFFEKFSLIAHYAIKILLLPNLPFSAVLSLQCIRRKRFPRMDKILEKTTIVGPYQDMHVIRHNHESHQVISLRNTPIRLTANAASFFGRSIARFLAVQTWKAYWRARRPALLISPYNISAHNKSLAFSRGFCDRWRRFKLILRLAFFSENKKSPAIGPGF